jgi:hypothetical protein
LSSGQPIAARKIVIHWRRQHQIPVSSSKQQAGVLGRAGLCGRGAVL